MWSIIMEPGKTYSTVVENTFHLSMATLDIASVKKADDIHTVYVEINDGPRVILCHLSKSSNMFQCALDHVITRGTDLKFVTSATANIHMTGYVDDLEEDDDEDQLYSDLESQGEEEEEEEEEESQISKKQSAEKGNKRKAENSFSKKPKSIKLDETKSTNSEDEDESDDTLDFEDDSDEGLTVSDMFDDEAESDDEVEDYDDDEDNDEEESEESDDEILSQSTKKAKINGNEQKTPKKEQKTPLKGQEKTSKAQDKTPKGKKTPIPKTPDANKSLINGTTESNKKKKNKEPKTPLDGLKTKPDTPLPKDKLNQQQKLNGGVIISDIKVGDGAVAKPGKNVKVYYVGRLKSTGKVFDSMQKGPGFSFGLQRGEVIKGWDIGIAGMRVGGKRKVICPPNMAYGAKGSPPEIPPNSTLVFDVELKQIN